MRTASHYTSVARKELADRLDSMPLSQVERIELSKLIAKFAAQVVREDRVKRHTHDALAKLCDVFFDGRSAC